MSKMFIFILASQLFLMSCVSSKALSANSFSTVVDGYPDAWWVIIPAEQIKSWEIPPQAARRDLGEVVLSKRTELGIFSNLSEAHFILDGQEYASIEGLWQGVKYPEGPQDERLKDPSLVWPYSREQVYKMSGFEAKKAGDIANENMKKLNIKWITYQGKKIEYKSEQGLIEHYNLIYRAEFEKVQQNEAIKKLLLKTGDLKLLPDHTQFPNAAPVYAYFDMLMKIRNDLKASEVTKAKK